MATKLDMEFVKAIQKYHQDAVLSAQNARQGFEALVNEVIRLEAICVGLESENTELKSQPAAREE